MYLFCRWSLKEFSGSEVDLSFLKEDGRNILKAGGLMLESVALTFFHGSGWNTLKRIEDYSLMFELFGMSLWLSCVLVPRNAVLWFGPLLWSLVSGRMFCGP
jgi:hypothetical protein